MECPTGKIAYSTKREARRASVSLSRRKKDKSKFYRCYRCGYYHTYRPPPKKEKIKGGPRKIRI